ncbi:MAG: Minf_1886 family protein [Verrucomicrobiota bacterium]
MQKINFSGVVETIMKDEKRYDIKAYAFVREGLDHTLKTLKRGTDKTGHNHVTGSELLEGLRQYTIKEFGPMGKIVLNEWGIKTCRDFGNIVFHLVHHGILGTNDNDKLEDFSEIWSFDEAFEKPFRPSQPVKKLVLRSEKDIKPRRLKSPKKFVAEKKDSPDSTDEMAQF